MVAAAAVGQAEVAAGLALSFRAVSHEFRLDGRPLPVLEAIDLDVAPGDFVALLGPSGCGKSTLLRLVADILQPTEGRITIGGHPPAKARRQHEIGFVFQDATLLPWRTVIDNVRLPLEIVGRGAALGSRPEALIELVGLAGFEQARPHQLSGGMQQRVAIARALAPEPAILIADEPTGNLDQATGRQIADLLFSKAGERGMTLVLVTHDPGLAARCTRQIAMRSGRIEAAPELAAVSA